MVSVLRQNFKYLQYHISDGIGKRDVMLKKYLMLMMVVYCMCAMFLIGQHIGGQFMGL